MTTQPPQVDLSSTEWKFIDRSTYRSLRENSKGVVLTDFADLGDKNTTIGKKLSPSTAEYLALLNDRIHYTLFGSGGPDCVIGYQPDQRTLNVSEISYLLEQVNDFLSNPIESDGPDCVIGYQPNQRTLNVSDLLEQVNDFLSNPIESDSVFYEILPIDDKNFLVVVENGFLNLLTQSKDTLLQFILACLGCLDRFKRDSSQLNRQYLRTKFIEGYHLLVKARAQS